MSENLEFKDYFSAQALEYSKFRPKYPDELFSYLSSLSKYHKLAWDCACGNGQASIGLADYFDKVIATDASSSQLEHAIQHPNICYKHAKAEKGGLETDSVDLVTAATAIHWIDTNEFYPEVKRVLKPEGIIAVWSYSSTVISPEIDKIMEYLSGTILKDVWPKENKKSWDFDNAIKFPFKNIEIPEFYLEMYWNLSEFINYVNTWSAVQKYIIANKSKPVILIENDLSKLWGDKNEIKKIRWKLNIKTGRV